MTKLHTWSEKITDEWELDIEYIYIPEVPATYDDPGYGAHIEIERILMWHKDWKTIENDTDMYDFFDAISPEWLREIEKKIAEHHETP